MAQQRKKIDNKTLIKMIADGTHQKDIMKKFGFKNSSQLKLAYVNALTEAGNISEIKSGRIASEKAINKIITINKRGTLSIPKALIEDLGFSEGDSFETKKNSKGISLKKIEVDPK